MQSHTYWLSFIATLYCGTHFSARTFGIEDSSFSDKKMVTIRGLHKSEGNTNSIEINGLASCAIEEYNKKLV